MELSAKQENLSCCGSQLSEGRPKFVKVNRATSHAMSEKILDGGFAPFNELFMPILSVEPLKSVSAVLE